jgi:hypothetical protein
MASSSNSSSYRFAILLPAGCQPDEAAALEHLCREAVAELPGQVLQVFVEDDIEPLVAAIQDRAVATIVYPPHESLTHDLLMAGIVRGVFRGVFGVTLCCAVDSDQPAIPAVLVRATQDIIENHLRSQYSQLPFPAPDDLPFGYRKVGDTVEIDSDQAEQVRDAFRDAATGR